MARIHVWTKQHQVVLDELNSSGRYITPKAYIERQHEDGASVFLNVYDWLATSATRFLPKPADAVYPVWLSYSYEATMLNSPDEVVLKLELDEELIVPVNINKWSMILNYSYIPLDEADAAAHQQMLKNYNTGDAKAVMTLFYPQIKQKIINSWQRLFDDSIQVTNDMCYGITWELRREWLAEVLR